MALVGAACGDGADLMELLLQHGADGNACGKGRLSAYTVAVDMGNRRAVGFLRSHGAKPLP